MARIMLAIGLLGWPAIGADGLAYVAEDQAGYDVRDNQNGGAQDPQFLYEDLSEGGEATQVNFGWLYSGAQDGGWHGPVPLGFDFDFFGGPVYQCWICSKGFITFKDPASTSPDLTQANNAGLLRANADIPGPTSQTNPAGLPNGFVAPFWDDLIPSWGGSMVSPVYYKTTGPGGQRRFVVRWRDMRHVEDPSSAYDFELVLYEEQGAILFQYKTVLGAPSTTVGIESPDGTEGAKYLYDGEPAGNAIAEGRAVGFCPTGARPPWGDLDVPPSESENDDDDDDGGCLGRVAARTGAVGLLPPVFALLVLMLAGAGARIRDV